MSASEFLRNEHQDILRLEKIITKSYKALYDGVDIPFSDIDKINFLIAEFLDSVHFTREEGSYFPCVASYDHLNKEIRELLIEHEFSRNIANSISKKRKMEIGKLEKPINSKTGNLKNMTIGNCDFRF